MKTYMSLIVFALLLALGCAGKQGRGDEAASKLVDANREQNERIRRLEERLKSTETERQEYLKKYQDTQDLIVSGETPRAPTPEPEPQADPRERSRVGFARAPVEQPERRLQSLVRRSMSRSVDPCRLGALGPGVAYLDGFPLYEDALSMEDKKIACGKSCVKVYNNSVHRMALFVSGPHGSGNVTVCSGGTSVRNLLPAVQRKGGAVVGELLYLIPPKSMVRMKADAGMYVIEAKFYALPGRGGPFAYLRSRKVEVTLPYEFGLRDNFGANVHFK